MSGRTPEQLADVAVCLGKSATEVKAMSESQLRLHVDRFAREAASRRDHEGIRRFVECALPFVESEADAESMQEMLDDADAWEQSDKHWNRQVGMAVVALLLLALVFRPGRR